LWEGFVEANRGSPRGGHNLERNKTGEGPLTVVLFPEEMGKLAEEKRLAKSL